MRGGQHGRQQRGDWYVDDDHLAEQRLRCWELVDEFNQLGARADDARRDVLTRLLGGLGEAAIVLPPFRCTYGVNTSLGPDAFLNHGVTVLDDATVAVGAHARVGPGVQLLTSIHPTTDHARRREGWERAAPVVVGDNAWLGAGVIVCPGVTVGDDAVVGAGSVVTRDVGPGTVVAGNPARPLRTS